jgi:hypothetical protein
MSGILKAVVAAGIVIFLAGIGQAQASQTFDCGKGINVVTHPQDETATFTIPGRDIYTVPVGGDGAYFSEQLQLAFRHGSSVGVLSLGNREFACQTVAATADGDPVATRDTDGQAVGTRGQSLGGNLRNGPGMEYDRLTSLPEGAYLTIVANTGHSMNGYDWFEVRLDNGDVAFMWGGILCSIGTQVPGIFAACTDG